MSFEKAKGIIIQLDDIYRTSPTAQLLINKAPQVLNLHRKMKQDMMAQQHEIDKIVAEREYDLEKFKLIAPALTHQIMLMGQEIRNLQKIVRDTAATIGQNPNAQVIIDYTNKQIQDIIYIFNNLSISLLTR